jgi:hypothetical protein
VAAARRPHIRVDIVLRALPRRAAYACEWLADILGLVSCLWLVVYGASAAWKSQQSAALSIKTLVMPEWWFLGAAAGLLRAARDRVRLSHASARQRRGRAARRRGERGMIGWVGAAWLLLAGSTALLSSACRSRSRSSPSTCSAPGSGSAASPAWPSSRGTASAR